MVMTVWQRGTWCRLGAVESALLLGLAVSNGVDVERSVVGYKWVTSDIFSACVISYVISNLGGAWADTE